MGTSVAASKLLSAAGAFLQEGVPEQKAQVAVAQSSDAADTEHASTYGDQAQEVFCDVVAGNSRDSASTDEL